MKRIEQYFSALFCLLILALGMGGLGGSFQAARIIAAAALPFIILHRAPADWRDLRWRAFSWMFGTFLLLGTLSLSWSMDQPRGAGVIGAVALGGAVVLLAKHMDRSEPWLRRIRLSWCLAMGFATIQGLYEIGTGDHFAYAIEARNLGGDYGEFPYAAGFFGNYNDFSVYLCMGAPFVLMTFFSERNHFSKIFSISIYSFIVYIVLANTSRGCIIALFISTVLILYWNARRYAPAIVFSVLMVSAIAYASGVFQNISEILRIRLESSGVSDSERSNLILDGFRGVFEFWGFGLGVGSFEQYMTLNSPSVIPSPHNIFLEIAANFGVLALFAFMFWIVALMLDSRNRRGGKSDNAHLVQCSLVCLPVLGIVSSQAIVYIYWFGWLACLAAFCTTQNSAQRTVTARTA